MTTPSAPRISDDELARLEELAGKATPGPWRGTTEGSYDQRHAAAKAFETVMARRLADNPDVQFSDLSWVRTEGDDYLNVALIGNGKDGPENAAYIAALSPDVVLRLIAAARSAPAAGLDVERLAKALDRGRHPLDALTLGVTETARRVAREYALAAEEVR